MSEVHRTQGATLTEEGGMAFAAHYGSPEEEALATARGAGLFDLSHWAKLRIAGPDRKAFLHGLITNEVKNLAAGQGNYSLLLTAQGKVIAEQWVLNREEEILLLARPALRQTLLTALDKYLIMEDATLEDRTEAYCLFSLQGPEAETILRSLIAGGPLPDTAYHHTEAVLAGASITVARISRTGSNGFDLLLPPEQGPNVWNRLRESGARAAGTEALDILRVEAGIPRTGKELDNTVIPQEAGLHHALSFTKGCYVGQEVVARLHFRGHVNRELTAFVLEGELLPEGEVTLVQGEKSVGKITSAVRSPRLGKIVGLGYLRCALREPGTEIVGQWEGKEFKATVAKIPVADE